MAKCISYEITGEIVKGVGYNGKQFGVPVELTFDNGEKRTYTYTADRKKDVVNAMLPGGNLESRSMAAHIDNGCLMFTYVFDLR